MKQQSFIGRMGFSVLAAAILTLAASFCLFAPDSTVSDLLYRERGTTVPDCNIIIVEMNNRDVEELGPMPWPRSVFAELIDVLNHVDPASKPAVIGFDVLFVGESADPDGDDYLAWAAGEGDNVVVASAAQFGMDLVMEGENFYLDSAAVTDWAAPYAALNAAADTGHINAMADKDGYIRHGMLWVTNLQGERVPSFARVLYERWCAASGEAVKAPPETESGFFYLPFSAPPGNYSDNISITDVLAGEVDPAVFAGKIVLVGPYTAGMQDEYRTAEDHAAPMYGIEINANVIDAFRNGFFPREVSDRLQMAMTFLIGMLAMAFFWERRVRYALPGWLLFCGGWIGLCLWLFDRGHILHALWVPLSVTVLFIVSVVLNYIRSLRERQRIANTFGRYVDPGIMRQLLEQGSSALELGGKTYDIAVLFVDIRGFTTMSESLEPPVVVEIINQYLTLTTDCIMRHHGTLDKFVGDCTMAFWNAPLPQEDPVFLACCAAMDMVEGAKTLAEQLQQRFGRSVSFGVGVHYGPAVVGNIGAPKRMDYTAIGDTVNTASRLESNAPAGTVYISRVVADALGDRAETTSLGGSIKLKGKSEGFEVLTLDRLRYH